MTNFHRIALLLLAAANLAFSQQVLVLNSGTRIEGRYDGGNADNVWFIDEHGNRHRFNISEIRALTFKPGPEPAPGVSNRYALTRYRQPLTQTSIPTPTSSPARAGRAAR